MFYSVGKGPGPSSTAWGRGPGPGPSFTAWGGSRQSSTAWGGARPKFYCVGEMARDRAKFYCEGERARDRSQLRIVGRTKAKFCVGRANSQVLLHGEGARAKFYCVGERARDRAKFYCLGRTNSKFYCCVGGQEPSSSEWGRGQGQVLLRGREGHGQDQVLLRGGEGQGQGQVLLHGEDQGKVLLRGKGPEPSSTAWGRGSGPGPSSIVWGGPSLFSPYLVPVISPLSLSYCLRFAPSANGGNQNRQQTHLVLFFYSNYSVSSHGLAGLPSLCSSSLL